MVEAVGGPGVRSFLPPLCVTIPAPELLLAAMARAVVTVFLSCASAAALLAEEHSLSPMLQVIVPDGAAAADNATTLATMARLVNAAMVSNPRVSMIFRGFPTGEASELGWEGLDECDMRLPEGGEHVKVAVGNNPSDSESLFAGWLELTEAQAQAQPTTLSGFVHQVRTQPAGAMPYSLFGLPVSAGYLAKVGLDVFDAVFGTAPGYFRPQPPNLYMHPSGGLLADTYAPGRPYCTYGLRVPASFVLCVPEAQSSLPRGGGRYRTYAVHVPASGVPYVPRTGHHRWPLCRTHRLGHVLLLALPGRASPNRAALHALQFTLTPTLALAQP